MPADGTLYLMQLCVRARMEIGMGALTLTRHAFPLLALHAAGVLV